MKNIELSIIVVNWNTKVLLERCLNSIVSNRISASGDRKKNRVLLNNADHRSLVTDNLMEIIVVDNGSTDGSIAYLDGIEQGLDTDGNLGGNRFEIRIIKNNTNLGFAKAVNQAIRQARGKALFLLNSDTQMTSGSLDKLFKFEKDHRPAVVGPKLINFDGTTQPSVYKLPTIIGAVKEYWFGQIGKYSKYIPDSDKPTVVESVVGGAMLISKQIIERVGLFDERYFFYFEDLDFCRRVNRAGYQIYYHPNIEVLHHHGASGKKVSDTDNQWRRLVPSSKIYFGLLRYYIITIILWLGQKFK